MLPELWPLFVPRVEDRESVREAPSGSQVEKKVEMEREKAPSSLDEALLLSSFSLMREREEQIDSETKEPDEIL